MDLGSKVLALRLAIQKTSTQRRRNPSVAGGSLLEIPGAAPQRHPRGNSGRTCGEHLQGVAAIEQFHDENAEIGIDWVRPEKDPSLHTRCQGKTVFADEQRLHTFQAI